MSITNELREYVQGWRETPNLMDGLDAGDIDGILTDFEHIADRIDAAHEEALGNKATGALLANEDGTEFLAIPASKMAERYIELPKDADGVPILVGDVMEGEKVGGGFGEPFEIVGYIMSNGELEPMDEHKLPRKRKYLHHHTQTVEEVLMEFMDVMLGTPSKDATARIAEYAAKLRLADDGGEQQ